MHILFEKLFFVLRLILKYKYLTKMTCLTEKTNELPGCSFYSYLITDLWPVCVQCCVCAFIDVCVSEMEADGAEHSAPSVS